MENKDKIQAIFFKGRAEDNFIGHIVAEIYKDKIYDPYLRGKKDLTILDFGGNIGISAYYFSQFASKVVVLEPSLRHFDTLTRMVEFNGLKDIVRPIRKALYTEITKLPFYHNANETMYSLYQNVNDNSSEPEMVETVTVEQLLKDEKIDHVDFMKLDVEGSEGEILAGSGFGNVADKIDTIVMETHSWGIRPLQQIKDALVNRGYKIEQIPNDATLFVATRL